MVGVVFTYHAVLTRVLNLFRLMTDFPGLVVAEFPGFIIGRGTSSHSWQNPKVPFLAEVPSFILGRGFQFHPWQWCFISC